MTLFAAPIVEWDKLAEVVVNSFVAGVGVAAIFGVAIFGATRMTDASRAGRTVQASWFAAVAAVSLAIVVASVVFGIVVMTTK